MCYSCPICQGELVQDYNDYIGYTQTEFGDHCKNGHYEYTFSYGEHYERIGFQQWCWSYSESSQETLLRSNQRKLVINKILSGNLHYVLEPTCYFNWRIDGF